MSGALLRSGSLSDFHSLGAVGKPVYSAASQLRATIRRRYGQDMADLFAIPKRHDQGDVIDWYAPQHGSVVPWSAATPEERAEAVSALESARQRLTAESETLQAEAETSERKVFGRLLAQATHIPGEDHIYLVDGRPVITFWGFHPLGAPGSLDVIGGLGGGAAAAAALNAEEEPPTDGVAADASLQAVVADQPRRRAWWWWLLPLLLLLLLLLLLFGLKSCGVPVPYTNWLPGLQDAPTSSVVPETAPPGLKPLLDAQGHPVVRDDGASLYVNADGRTVAVLPDGRRVVLGADGLPAPQQPPDAGMAPPPPSGTDQPPGTPPTADKQPRDAGKPPAEATKPPEAAPPPAPKALDDSSQHPLETPPQPGAAGQTQPGVQPPGVAETPQGTPLSIPEAAVRAGDTSFLSGAWRSITGLQDKAGNPVDLSYDFTNGQGPVTLRRSVGGQQQTCTGQVGSTMQDGRLTIDQTQVRCPDGSVFQKSKVVCTPGADGRARCQGVNENGSTYDVDIVK